MGGQQPDLRLLNSRLVQFAPEDEPPERALLEADELLSASVPADTSARDVGPDRLASMLAQAAEYEANTETLTQMNEAYNANRYVNNALAAEQNRLSGASADAAREVRKAQQAMLETAFSRGHARFVINFLLAGLLALGVVAIALAAWLTGANVVAAALLGVVAVVGFAIAAAVLVQSDARRRRYHWTQRIWRAPGQQEQNSCASSSSWS